MSKSDLTIAIAIATASRREVLSETVAFLQAQSRPADEILICPAKPQDADEEALKRCFPALQIVRGPIGLPAQRNTIMATCTADVIIFFDDDFLPAPDYLSEVERLLEDNSDIVVATGEVLADGILGPGLGFDEGATIVARAGLNNGGAPRPTYNAYGCNMIIRAAPARAQEIRFDENLPLYAWLEDVDFSRRLAPYGRIVQAPRLRGVHLGTKRSGRSPGKQLGYSQVANPLYLARKGTMSWPFAVNQIARNLAANSIKLIKPEPWVDRKGRIMGNLVALKELVSGRMHPTRILEIGSR